MGKRFYVERFAESSNISFEKMVKLSCPISVVNGSTVKKVPSAQFKRCVFLSSINYSMIHVSSTVLNCNFSFPLYHSIVLTCQQECLLYFNLVFCELIVKYLIFLHTIMTFSICFVSILVLNYVDLLPKFIADALSIR